MHVLQMKRLLRLFLAMVLLITGAIPAGLFSSKAAAADEPLTVAQAMARNNDGLPGTVEGYVIGYFDGSKNKLQTIAPFSGGSNFGLADNPGETDLNRILSVQIPNITSVRNTFGLNSNPELLGKKVRVTNGTLTSYLSLPGIKYIDSSSTTFQLIDETPETKVASVRANPSSGAVPAGTQVTLETPTVGATVYYKQNTDADYLPYTVPITINDAIHIETYAVKEGIDNSDVTSFDYTLVDTAPIPISEARKATENSTVTVQGIVTYSELSGVFNLYIQDNDAGIVVRGNASGIEVGDQIEAYGPITIYNGLVQVEASKSGFQGGYIRTVEKSQDLPSSVSLNSSHFAPGAGGSKGYGGQYEGMLVEVNNIKVTKSNTPTYTATDEHGGQMLIYAKNSLSALSVGKSYHKVTGVLTYHSTYGLELIPRTASDILEDVLSVTASTPSGGIVKGTEVTLSSPYVGAQIFYTLDGSEPTENSMKYTQPITITQNQIIKAVATADSRVSTTFSFGYTAVDRVDGVRIHEIQGAGHYSIYDGLNVQNVDGIVTSLVNADSFYMQSIPGQEDGDPATSEGILIYKKDHGMKVKDQVKVAGKVKEYAASATDLPTTEIVVSEITLEQPDVELPQSVIIGKGGRVIPKVIDSDGLGQFNPDVDAIDFYESLEGMRIQLDDVTILGPYSYNPGLAVTVDNEPNNSLRTPAGGLILRGDGAGKFESSLNPQRLFINKKPPQAVTTGDKFRGSIKGVLSYSGGNYKVNLQGDLPPITSNGLKQATTSIEPQQEKLTVATFNVENFSKKDATRANKIGKIIVDNLKTPDILGIMEVQDNDGDADTGTTAADESFQTLIDAIKANKGPTYQYSEIAPENNKDGGAPGANIRVGFLYQPDRVSLATGVSKGNATTAIAVKADGSLSVNPGRIAPGYEAFASSRKPLAAEFEFNGERVVVIANHFNSKGGDLAPFGNIQPVTRISEVQRAQQATVVNKFVNELINKDPDVNVAVLGDFNDFQFSKTLSIVEGNELDNLVNKLPENKRYSYIYDGNSQTLDHILVSKNLTDNAAIEVVHVNADFETADGRVSDHDPLLAQLTFIDNGNGSNPGNGGGNNGSDPGSGNSGGGSTTPATPVTPTTPTTPTNPTNPTTTTVPGNGGTNPTTPVVDLKDIGNHWAAVAIEQAISRGIVNGYQDGNFRPNAPATRAEFIVMLGRAFELPASNKALTFKDAAGIPAWAQSFIAQAVDQGIISGYTDDTFRSSGKVSRVEMTVMLVRALGLPVQSNPALSFVDADKVPAWAVPYIAAAYDAGLVKGTGKNMFNPLAEATRAEVVTLLLSASEFQAK
ncbi:S-layer homology domain-containing protein [Paenibacillus xylanexedens]|uniref:S-layer homology domain-containing protein n=1 Tax=Paenibacillus xylanexedens TaxID=528191 RepID=UPI003D08E3EE